MVKRKLQVKRSMMSSLWGEVPQRAVIWVLLVVLIATVGWVGSGYKERFEELEKSRIEQNGHLKLIDQILRTMQQSMTEIRSDMSQMRTDVVEIKADSKVLKTDVEWIKRQVQK